MKEPVGWFVLATAVSVIVGLYLAPIGWTLAASLASVIAVGMVWPAVAVRAVNCRVTCGNAQIHEGDRCELHLAVRNRLPLPVWGLAVEGFLDRTREQSDQAATPTVALAFVHAWAISNYRFSVQPELRGRYPDGDAILTCSFPFGIWTAKRKLQDVASVTVWPRVFSIAGQTAMTGRRNAESGEGNRTGRTGDFVGVREYRRGDCVRQVNWVATARSGELVVTERSGPECPSVEVIVDVAGPSNRDQLADRIRVAASVLANLHQSAVPLRVHLGQRRFHVKRGWEGWLQMMDALADVPEGGLGDQRSPNLSRQQTSITIASDHRGDIVVCVADPSVNPRLMSRHSHQVIRRDHDLASQLFAFWTEVRDANLVA
ncbi:DUF58 domain-containing protein [Stieleria sp. ICT_E10.1]|uniref:DUF58 domain-containing protein n=1 Tax=Stieleria sedimenti TaxID=2976331 RepID=UPI00218029DC|nr:DUF58 domain-containing protein [Stieleria sedimenti]MCS7469469.1 DUF58 domain-containing protein [Stieleria sedimenti]